MNANWPLVKLGDYVDLFTGNPFKSKDFSDSEGVKLLRGDNIVQGKFRWENVKRWPESLLIEKHQSYFLQEGDVILAMDRPWIEAGLKYSQISKHDLPCLLVQRTSCLRAKAGLRQDFLKYVIASYDFVEYVKLVQTGTAVPHISGKQIKDFEFKLPPESVQKTIGRILKTLDSKVQLNVQTNQTLEQIAQAIFKSWFVDFEPVKAKIAAREALIANNPTATAQQIAEAEQQAAIKAISGASDVVPTERLQTLAELFPNQLVESELGDIPEGWQVKLSGEVFDVRDGTHDSPKKSELGFPLVTSKHITTGVLRLEDTYLISPEDYEKVNKRSAVETGDILLTMIGTVGIPYLVQQENINFAIKNVGLFKASGNQLYKSYFYLLLKTTSMQSYLEARLAGTTQKYLSLKTLRNIEFICPDSNKLVESFNSYANLFLKQSYDNVEQNDSLSALRNVLLPKLFSGEIELINKEVAQ